jgi:Tol biopolymer transport system component
VSYHEDIAILETLDRPVEPRADFAAELWLLLEAELKPAETPVEPRVGWFRRRSTRVRVALVLAVLVILGVGAALAAQLAHEWENAGHGGLQVRPGVSAGTTLNALGGSEPTWARFALGPQGHDVYEIGYSPNDIAGAAWRTSRAAALRVYHGVDTPHPTVSRTTLALPDELGNGWISVAPTGQVFLGLAHSVVTVDSHGRVTTVVSVKKLGIPNHLVSWELGTGIAVAAVSTHDLIVRVGVGGWHNRDYGDFRFYEVTDPNRDGNWSDVAVRRLVLPRSVPVSVPGPRPNPWESVQLLAESSAPGGASSTAVIVTMLSLGGEFRVYQLDDRNGDGDVTDPGETQLLLDQQPSSAVASWGPTVAVRKASTAGGRPELVAGALTRQGRISLISPTGRIQDIARSIPINDFIEGMLAGPNGRIYPLIRSLAHGENWKIYRFTDNTDSIGATSNISVHGPTWSAPHDMHGPLLALATSHGTEIAAASGGGRKPFLSRRALSPCLSTDGHTIYYQANLEAKNEWYLYAAHENQSAHKVTEQPVNPICPAPKAGMLLAGGNADLSQTLIWHATRTGRERTIVRNVLRFTVSADGTHLAYIGGLDFSDGWPPRGRERLILDNLVTGKRFVVASAPPDSSFGVPDRTGYDAPPGQDIGLRWSPDGRHIAYLTGPNIYRRALWPAKIHDSDFTTPPQRYTLWVRSATTGNVALRRTIVGGPPSVSWSPNGTHLLVCTNTSTLVRGCPDQLLESPDYNSPATQSVVPHSPTRLLVINLATGDAITVAHSPINYAEWNPAGETIAFATRTALYEVGMDGHPQLVVRAPGGNWAGTPLSSGFAFAVWHGYSRDGHYIAVSRGSDLDVIDMSKGTIRWVAKGQPVFDAAWWQPGMNLEGSWRPLWG